ncbi:MAG: hypothetical protein ACLPTZ_26120 [Beijerinckiaceae bacterium]
MRQVLFRQYFQDWQTEGINDAARGDRDNKTELRRTLVDDKARRTGANDRLYEDVKRARG